MIIDDGTYLFQGALVSGFEVPRTDGPDYVDTSGNEQIMFRHGDEMVLVDVFSNGKVTRVEFVWSHNNNNWEKVRGSSISL